MSNLEASVRWERDSGWHAKPYLGVTRVLNPGSLECDGSEEAVTHCETSHGAGGERRIYGGISFGRSW